MTNQTHREFVHRQAYFLGRHIIGLEIQKILALIDGVHTLFPTTAPHEIPMIVAGYGEGGLLALTSAALDERIESTLVSGYFDQRESLWEEPVYRNVWGLLRDFGDAEIASLVCPRRLIVEDCRGPEVPGPPAMENRRAAAGTGRIATPSHESVNREFMRAKVPYQRLHIEDRLRLIASPDQNLEAGSSSALAALLPSLRIPDGSDWVPLIEGRRGFDPMARMKRQFDGMVDFCQTLMRESVFKRVNYWSRVDMSSLEKYTANCEPFRETLLKDIIGDFPKPSEGNTSANASDLRNPNWRGYEVTLDVWPEVFAYGILLVPKGIHPEERRPVVVAQHGRGGRPQDVCNPDKDTPAYHSFGAKLADEGFVVFAPQNLYLGEEKYRQLQRKATPLGYTFFAPMVRQHEQILRWLGQLPFVDAERIGFYGLSYGGKSAMLIPAVVPGYSLSICSGDFNEEVWKHVSIDDRYSFMFTNEHDHSEFDFAEKFNYAEIAGLIAPRPFMVERGHRDGVAPDEWVAYEYAKVRRLYVNLGIPERTEIEFFPGVHEIHLNGTLGFLRKHLSWPVK